MKTAIIGKPAIVVEIVPHRKMRYDTLGDWFKRGDALVIQISDRCNKELRTEFGWFLVALHEQVEVTLCKQRGITEKAVDKFDFAFKGKGEPGDAKRSPYRLEHRFAMLIEHLMAHELGVIGYGKVE